MRSRPTAARWFAALCAAALAAPAALAGPHLTRVTPPGGQRGTAVEVEFVGRDLVEPRQVLFYGPGITAQSLEVVTSTLAPNGKTLPLEPGFRVRAKLTIAADCPLGPHGVRL